jgi:hypothetical protein
VENPKKNSVFVYEDFEKTTLNLKFKFVFFKTTKKINKETGRFFNNTKFDSKLSSTFILDGYQTGEWDFQNNAVLGYDTLTFGNMKLKNHSFFQSINGSEGMNLLAIFFY